MSPVLPLALGSLALVGCEDGPDQTFAPAPSNAASIYNGTDGGTTSDPGSQGFTSGGGGTNAVNICTPAQQTTQWSVAFQAAIVPPFSVGGMDLSVGNSFNAYTIEDAEQGALLAGLNGATVKEPQLCQGVNAAGGCTDGSGNPSYNWGPSGQLGTCYDIASHQLTFFYLTPGYDGAVTFTLPAKDKNGTTVPRAVDQNGKAGDLTYVWHIGQPITENGVPLNMGWTSKGATDAVMNKLYLGLMNTFQPSLIAVTNTKTNPPLTELTDATADCKAKTTCRTSADTDGSAGNFGVRPVGIYADFALSNSTDVNSASSPSDIYMYPVKFVPYSLSSYDEGLDTFVGGSADPTLKYNGAPIYGPYAPAGQLPTTAKTPPGGFCTLYMGETFSDYLKNCINVQGDHGTTGSLDDLNLAKLLGAQHHTAEWYQFSVVGVNQNFNADTAELTQNGQPSVLPDTDGTLTNPPHSDDQATNFIVDVRASGAKLNDTRGNQYPTIPDPSDSNAVYEDANLNGLDLHGSGAIVGYFRQLVQNDLQKQLFALNGKTPITPAQIAAGYCWYDGVTPPAQWNAPAGCTGFEQLISPQGVSATPDPTGSLPSSVLDFGPVLGHLYGYASFFQPGDPILMFVSDPATNGNLADQYAPAGSLVQAALQQVTYFMGHGSPQTLPSEVRDWRYFFTFWAQAFTKYLLNRSYNNGNITWQDLYQDDLDLAAGKTHALREVNQDQLFFDLNNGLDKFEYVDRTHANALGSPIDFEYDILLLSSNTQDENFFQRLEREEKALYQTMLGAVADDGTANGTPITLKTDVPGSNDNVNLSDLFGSPAVNAGGFCGGTPDKFAAGTSTKDGFYCCTHFAPGSTSTPDPDCYIAATAAAPTARTLAPPTDSTGAVMLDGQGRPLFYNYHGIFTGTQWTIGASDALKFTTPLPYIASAIINLSNYANPYDLTSKNTPLSTLVPWTPDQPNNGFEIPINAERSQFIQTGSLDFSGVTITMNVDYIPSGADGSSDGTIAAVETQDFLGEVFPCFDPVSGDLLRVKMYTSVLAIQDWFNNHPGAQTACNVFIRYSPYDNYADYVVSNTYGVYLSINPGAGGGPGRISDATLFNPAYLTQTQ